MGKPVIFISHISEEGILATMLKRQLCADFLGMVDVFVSSDTLSIKAGSNWFESLKIALQDAIIMIVLCSDASLSRPWINIEAGAGLMRGIPVVPVCHTGLHPRDLPMPFSFLQAVQANQANGVDRIYSLIASALGADRTRRNYGKLVRQIESFEATYSGQLQDLLQAEAKQVEPAMPIASEPLGKRLIGSWEGTAEDINVPKYLKFDPRLSYYLEMELRRDGDKICGELNIGNKATMTHRPALVEINHISGEFFSFKYRIADVNASHYGVTLMQMLAHGEKTVGFFLSKKIFESKIGFGRVEFTRKPPKTTN